MAIAKVKGVDKRNTRLFNELIDSVNNGTGGGGVTNNLDFYFEGLHQLSTSLYVGPMMVPPESEIPITIEEYNAYCENLILRLNRLASKAYQSGLSVGGLGFFNFTLSVIATMGGATQIVLVPEVNNLFDHFFELVEKAIDDNKSIDGLSSFYGSLMPGLIFWSMYSVEEESSEMFSYLMSYATPFMSIIDKIFLDNTVNPNINYNALLSKMGINLFMLGMLITEGMPDEYSFISIEEFIDKFEMLPWEYYLANGGVETYNALLQLTKQHFLLKTFFDVIENREDASFVAKTEKDLVVNIDWDSYWSYVMSLIERFIGG